MKLKRRDLIVLVIIIVVALGAVIGYMTIMRNLKPDSDKTIVLRDAIETIEVVTNLDLDYDNADYDERISGQGSLSILSLSYEELKVILVDGDRLALIEISYVTRLFTKKISIESINIGYVDFKKELYVDVTWEDYSNNRVYNYDGTISNLEDYLLDLTLYDIYKLLIDSELISK